MRLRLLGRTDGTRCLEGVTSRVDGLEVNAGVWTGALHRNPYSSVKGSGVPLVLYSPWISWHGTACAADCMPGMMSQDSAAIRVSNDILIQDFN